MTTEKSMPPVLLVTCIGCQFPHRDGVNQEYSIVFNRDSKGEQKIVW